MQVFCLVRCIAIRILNPSRKLSQQTYCQSSSIGLHFYAGWSFVGSRIWDPAYCILLIFIYIYAYMYAYPCCPCQAAHLRYMFVESSSLVWPFLQLYSQCAACWPRPSQSYALRGVFQPGYLILSPGRKSPDPSTWRMVMMVQGYV